MTNYQKIAEELNSQGFTSRDGTYLQGPTLELVEVIAGLLPARPAPVGDEEMGKLADDVQRIIRGITSDQERHRILENVKVALRAAPRPTPSREEIARKLAAWIGYDWSGLRDDSATDRGFPEWAQSGTYQGGKAGLLRFADSLTGEVRKASYCIFCDLENELHEDAKGFHHVIKGVRRACANSSAIGGRDE